MLDATRDAGPLKPVHVGDPDPRGEQRILGKALEVPAAVRAPVQVHRRSEQHVDALAPGLVRQQGADTLDPGALPGLAAYPGRAVGEHHPAQPGVGFGVERPEVRAGQEPDLLLHREAGDPGPQFFFLRATYPAYSTPPHRAGRVTR